MATVNDKSIVDKIIAGKGYYPGDSIRVVRIVQYNNDFDYGIAYGLIYEEEDLNRYFVPQCHNAKVIWELNANR